MDVIGSDGAESFQHALTKQAADIRADNGKIVGAFVLKGDPLSWGLSKRGYCGIIDGKLTVGVAVLRCGVVAQRCLLRCCVSVLSLGAVARN